jgi:hypothetical protein
MNTLLLACAVCGAGEDAASGPLLTMTIIISLLPLGMLGGLIGYIAYRSKRAAAERAPVALETGK